MEDLTQKLDDITRDSYTGVSVALGLQLGLFDCITSKPKTIDEISQGCNCKPRYVKEWLCVMVTAGLIDSEDGDTFFMSEERKLLFFKHSIFQFGANFLPLVMGAYAKVAECFKTEGPGGTKYDDYAKYYMKTIVATDETTINQYLLESEIAVKFDKGGCQYLDVGCGLGAAVNLTAKMYPKSTCYGIDIVKDAIKSAQDKCAKENLPNVNYLVMNATEMPNNWTNFFDYITTFDAIHDQADPQKALSEIYRVLKPNGTYSMVDIEGHSNILDNKQRPNAAMLYTISIFHCMPVSLGVQGDGAGLGALWGREKATELLEKAGFIDIKFYSLNTSIGNFHCVSRKPR